MPKPTSLIHPFRLASLTDDLEGLSERILDYNDEHRTLRRINRSTFRFDTAHGTELLSAATVRQFVDYHSALCADEGNPSLVPAYYDNFACAMNSFDESGYGWARLSEDGAIIWDEALEPADANIFCVLDSDMDNRVYLRPGEAAISQVELADYRRLKDAETKSNVKWRARRGEEKAKKELEAGGMVTISLDAFTKKRKRLQRDIELVAAQKKAKVAEEEEAANSAEGMSVDDGTAVTLWSILHYSTYPGCSTKQQTNSRVPEYLADYLADI
ncbi:hypothetical protein C8R44DRAFT_904331 [Mycena epipterygia]|nr:hypothetical protein C8R44DRAFT_904331 [Mycena epipterygia]